MKATLAPVARLLLVACLLAQAAPTRALDLTGTWSLGPVQGMDESGRCTYLAVDGESGRLAVALGPLTISQNGFTIVLRSQSRVLRYQGVAYPTDADRGRAIATSCGLTSADVSPFPGTFEIRKADAVRGTMKGTFVGQLLFPPLILSCTFEATRTSTADPGIVLCP